MDLENSSKEQRNFFLTLAEILACAGYIFYYRTNMVSGILNIASRSINYLPKTWAKEDQSISNFFHHSLVRIFQILQPLQIIMNQLIKSSY